jgi:hypothetical protein
MSARRTRVLTVIGALLVIGGVDWEIYGRSG